jgi:hypothetical protein
MRPGLFVALLFSWLIPVSLPGWSGETWGPISRATIKANADLMIDSTWVAKNAFANFQYGSTYQNYSKGATYKGVAYSQDNPQENWTEFYRAVTNTSGGSAGYGNDCSGFVSICWKLPARYTTYSFESKLGTYWTSLGDIGSSASVSLLPGDGINRSSSHIIMFLNYEGSGIRSMEQTPDNAQRRLWSYSGLANYRPIRRLSITDAPTISGDGLSYAVDAGQPLRLSVAASGSGTLRYQWRFQGQNLAGATLSQFVLNPARLANSGEYCCVVANTSGSVTSRVSTVTVYPAHVASFLDDFETDSTARWQLNRSSTDTRVTFYYDYSKMGIPLAPHSSGGAQHGLRMEANLSAGATAALSLSPRNQFFGGDYRLRFDMWINVNGPLPDGGTGSTEFVTAGVGTVGSKVQWPGNGSAADGIWFATDGEGGAGDTSTSLGDFCVYSGPSIQQPASGVYAAGEDTSAKGNINRYYITAFPGGAIAPALQQADYPQQTGGTAAGSLGFGWHDVIVARSGNKVEWIIDGIRLATVTQASLSGSNVFVGYWDGYASISDNPNLSFGLVDNVRVEVPAVPPSIASQPSGGAVWEGSNFVFSVAATGTPPLAYQWQSHGTNIPGATESTCLLSNLKCGQSGSYSVIVSNIAGTDASTGALLVVTRPIPPRLSSASREPGKGLRFVADCSPGRYVLDVSTNLIHWDALTNLVIEGAQLEYSDPGTNRERYYRLRQLP